jgi:hypothetical protein
MWLLGNDSFLSVIASDKDPAVLVVRARRTGDLQHVFGNDIEVVEIPGRDYRYRAFLPRSVVAAVMAKRIMNIDYTNVKGSVKDNALHDAMMEVWGVMEKLQEIPAYRTKPRPGFNKHPRHPTASPSIDITEGSKVLFVALAKDAGNWSGTPLFGGNVGTKPADKGHLTALKKAGLVRSWADEENKRCHWVAFTNAGVLFAASLGLTVVAQ